MNTNPHQNQQVVVILKDGKMPLAEWTTAFDQSPSLGQAIPIPLHLQTDLVNYQPTAIVSKIEQQGSHISLIELAASCQLKDCQRPLIVLNSARIRQDDRATVINYLCSQFLLPIIEWETSHHAEPVLRFHEPATGRKTHVADLQLSVRGLLRQPAKL